MKKLSLSLAILMVLSIMFAVLLGGCAPQKQTNGTDTDTTTVTTVTDTSSGEQSSSSDGDTVTTADPGSYPSGGTEPSANDYHDGFKKADYTVSYGPSDTWITLSGASATVSGDGATASGGLITITAKGTYVVTGSITNGQIHVKAPSSDKVHIVLLNATIKNSASAPIYIESTDKCTVTVIGNNMLEDAAKYTFPNGGDKPNACLFASTDLTLNGNGTLTVKGYYNNGIGTTKDLKIVSGTIKVEAANNGIKGNNSVYVIGGNINVSSGGDGIKTDDEKVDKEDKIYGYFTLDGGTINIDALGGGIEVVGGLKIVSGTLTIKSGSSGININKNGLANKHGMTMSGGSVTINSSSNGIKSTNNITVTDGLVTVKAAKEVIKLEAPATSNITSGCLVIK